MTKEQYITLLKFGFIFGGGFLIFKLFKPKNNTPQPVADGTPTPATATSFDGVKIDPANAEIVAKAYSDAMKAGEPPSQLTELNKECIKEFGMRCYMDKDGRLVVCDAKGNVIA